MDKKQALGVVILIIIIVLIYFYRDKILPYIKELENYIKGLEHKSSSSSTTHTTTTYSSPEIIITYND